MIRLPADYNIQFASDSCLLVLDATVVSAWELYTYFIGACRINYASSMQQSRPLPWARLRIIYQSPIFLLVIARLFGAKWVPNFASCDVGRWRPTLAGPESHTVLENKGYQPLTGRLAWYRLICRCFLPLTRQVGLGLSITYDHRLTSTGTGKHPQLAAGICRNRMAYECCYHHH